jgi:RNA polymerase primary sigma factor
MNKKTKMSKEEEYDLLAKAQAGDTESIHKIYLQYEDLILKISHSLVYSKIELEDLKQEGFIGMVEAINRFDFNKNLRFITFAYFWIYNKISKFTRDNAHTVRPSANLINLAIKVKKYSNQYWKRFNEYPDISHLAKQFKTSHYYMREVLSLFSEGLSLDNEIVPDSECGMMDYFFSKSIDNRFSSNGHSSNIKIVQDILSEIDPMRKDIIEKSFGIGQRRKNSKQIAKIYKISESECECIKIETLSSISKKARNGDFSSKKSLTSA